MGSFAVGDVVTVIFPYANFSAFKKRPALIIGQAEFGNFITCQITSKAATSKKAIPISDNDFSDGGLRVDSYVRPDKIFTLEESIIHAKDGSLSKEKLETVKTAIRDLFR
jgi:mRNA interferase MazF